MADFLNFLLDQWILSTAFVVVLLMLLITELRGSSLGFKDLTPAEVVRLINREDAVVIDVRDEADYKAGHIVNALHLPVGLMEARLGELEPYRERPFVLVCRTGQVAARGCVTLKKQGFNTIYKLSGGMLAWLGADLPVEKVDR
ncbi:MAG: rhodanese domain-containing protein [Halothiobacillaceae bacterium]|nr:MAG: rhodanese domain-containing protein [Halothiobacillaceae bacterium]